MSKDQKCFLQKAIRIDITQYVELFMYVVTNVNLVYVGRQQHFFILSFFSSQSQLYLPFATPDVRHEKEAAINICSFS